MMKTERKSLMAWAFGALLIMSSCSELDRTDIEYDISPIVPYVYVYDEDENNLLDSSTGESLDVSQIYVTFRGVRYNAETDTKAWMPYFFGLKLSRDLYGNMMLMFGELDGTEDFDNEDLTIYWGDGTSDVVTIFNNFRWKNDGSPSITRRFHINGEQSESEVAQFVFTKK